jgi:hypothetical protein
MNVSLHGKSGITTILIMAENQIGEEVLGRTSDIIYIEWFAELTK